MKVEAALARLAAALGCLALAACAQQNPAYRDGMQSLAEGRIEQGLEQLERASRESPGNPEYRSALYRQREVALNYLLTQADSARLNDDFKQAEAGYRRALNIDPANARARQGLEELATAQRHKAMVDEAAALIKANDRRGAVQRLRAVLAESPRNREARALLQGIEESRVRETLAGKSLKADLRRPITLEFRDAGLRGIFEAIARTSGVNYVFDKDVRPDLRTTIQLRNKNIEDAVNVLLVTNQLEQKILDEDTVVIYPATPAKQREYQELSIKAFYLANADVKQVINTIRAVIKTRDLIFDERSNVLVMRDTPDAIRAAEKLVALQDQADPEVMLEVEVMEVNAQRLQNLGIQFPGQISYSLVGAANIPGTITLPEWQNRDSSLVRMTVPNPALIVNLLKTDTDTKLLANPRVRARNREKARIHIGERVPVITTIQTANVGTSESVTYLDVGLKLEVESNIYLEDEVAMKVGLEVSNILETITRASGTTVYRLGTRNAATVLRLKDGETQVLAGLIQSTDQVTANKVPGLGELPVVGRLFTNRNDNNNKTEIVLLITPHIVRNIVRPNADIAEFASGAEARLGGGTGGVPFSPVGPISPPAPPASVAKPPVTPPAPQFIPFTPPGTSSPPPIAPGGPPGPSPTTPR